MYVCMLLFATSGLTAGACGPVFRSNYCNQSVLASWALLYCIFEVNERVRSLYGAEVKMQDNSLPDDLRTQQDYESFRQGLKTWLFSRY